MAVAFRQLITRLTEHLKDLDKLVDEFETQIKAWHRGSELSMKLEKIPGIGLLGASALVASIADANSFDNGRQLSAWLGLVPRRTLWPLESGRPNDRLSGTPWRSPRPTFTSENSARLMRSRQLQP